MQIHCPRLQDGGEHIAFNLVHQQNEQRGQQRRNPPIGDERDDNRHSTRNERAENRDKPAEEVEHCEGESQRDMKDR